MKRRERQDGLALIDAVESGDLEASRALLDGGVNATQQAKDEGYLEIAQMLRAAAKEQAVDVEITLKH
jgi:hypothetical protein